MKTQSCYLHLKNVEVAANSEAAANLEAESAGTDVESGRNEAEASGGNVEVKLDQCTPSQAETRV